MDGLGGQTVYAPLPTLDVCYDTGGTSGHIVSGWRVYNSNMVYIMYQLTNTLTNSCCWNIMYEKRNVFFLFLGHGRVHWVLHLSSQWFLGDFERRAPESAGAFLASVLLVACIALNYVHTLSSPS